MMSAPPRIPITRPVVGEPEAAAAAAVVRSGWLAMGREVAELERAVAAFVGASHAVAVSSGTAALHLALLGIGLGPGDEVILPSLSFIATANVVRYCGARPVFVDVDRRTFNLDPAQVERAVTSRTRAILPVHQLGLPADLDPLLEVAERRGLQVVEDAACALGASYGGKPVGTFGRAGCFSFHPRKIITTGEGGLIATADEELAETLRSLRSQGVSVSAEARHAAAELVFEEYPRVGYNYRLTDIQAAVGLAQMKRLPALLDRRRELAHRYTERLGAVEGIVPPEEPSGRIHSYQSYMVLLEGPWSRRALMQHLLDRGIASRRAVTAIHLAPPYRDLASGAQLPVTEHVARRGLMLPLFPEMTEEEQDQVIEALTGACS
jgi:dTDP-4-amino-4,6-dideoxygalactose transaminase